jgi:hypothetical protein
MVNWFAISGLLVCASLLNAQWASASGYPQSQYPGDPNAQVQQAAVQSASEDAPDPADLQHGVARISIAQGDVNLQRGDNGQLTAAVANTPMMTRDHLQTSSGSRAEVQLDAVTLLRLAPNSDVGFANLEYHRAQVQLGLGTVIFEVLQTSPTQLEIDTPSIGVRAVVPGEYRISVFDNGTSQITVRSGQLDVSGPRGSEHLEAGRSILVRGDASDPEMQDVSAPALDQFDEWSQARDREFASTQSYQYVNADMQGAEDLDRYGNWVPSGYGQVWHPQGVTADWSPYSNGQWSYVDYYGWSWVDYSPWGWAPYHYGRWFFNSGYGWCWWPGGRLHPAYWSPALVGFFGFGDGLGWVALGPYERCHPWWGRGGYGFGFGGGFGLGGYRNAGFRGGALFASYHSFGGIHEHFGFATRSQIAGGHAINGRLPITATRASYSFSNRQAFASGRFAAAQSRSFFNQGAQARSFSSASSSQGWQRFGSPGPAARQSFQGQNESSPWHSFGQPRNGENSYRAAPQYNNSFRQSNEQQRSAYQYSAPRQSYSAPRQSYGEPRQSYSAPRQNYSSPRQNYSAPRQSEPHSSAPSGHSSGGGGSHGGGGGGGHHGR